MCHLFLAIWNFKEAGDVDKTFFWPIIIQRTKVFLEAYAIPSKKTQRKMGVHVLVSMVTEQIYWGLCRIFAFWVTLYKAWLRE